MLEKAQAIVLEAPFWIQFAAQFLMALTLAATVLTRVIKGDKDDIAVGKFTQALLKVLHWLPTIGINPQTKKLEEALKEVKEK